ncbi:MAG: tetratricopeptide repeat protein [Porphyromonadaceae bacterium]|nr:MAG: tetratricopeptide repeat protein [Porphyromonadaceae bacterium]TSA38279.1 MAG: tetratricopeptide repeat protein [Porphyromonadaceae bacterium]
MKKVIFLLACIVGVGAAFGQSNKVVTAYNLMKPEYMELDKAKQAIDEASVHPKTSMGAKTWYYRGLVYYKIYQSKDEKYKNLDPDPLKQAYLSFVKAKELDVNNRYEVELLFQLTRCSADYFNRGGAEYEQKKFDQAVESFETVIAIGKLPYINQLDTVVFFNAALAAQEAGAKDTDKESANKFNNKAIDYYTKSIELNYGGAEVFHYIAEIYLLRGDSATALKTYEAGIKKFPDTAANLYIAMINFYLGRKEVKSAFGFVEKALEKDSSNASLWQVYGRALEDKDKQKAIDAYKKMIELDPKNFNGYYNVGTVYFNMGVEANDKANAIPLSDEAGYKAALIVADNYFKEALPFFEQAYEVNKEDAELLSGLKQLYYRFKMNDKLQEVQKRIDALK